jgi:hypothetical protein
VKGNRIKWSDDMRVRCIKRAGILPADIHPDIGPSIHPPVHPAIHPAGNSSSFAPPSYIPVAGQNTAPNIKYNNDRNNAETTATGIRAYGVGESMECKLVVM